MFRYRFLIVAVPVLIVLIVVGLWLNHFHKDPLQAMQNRVQFNLVLPAGEWRLDPTTLHYDAVAGVALVTYHHAPETVVMSEQAEPASFTDIPGYYDKLLGRMHQYALLSTTAGPVNLTRPEELRGGQSAVLVARGTLLFAQPSSDWSISNWQVFLITCMPPASTRPL